MTRIESGEFGTEELFSDNIKHIHLERLNNSCFILRLTCKDNNEHTVWLDAKGTINAKHNAY